MTKIHQLLRNFIFVIALSFHFLNESCEGTFSYNEEDISRVKNISILRPHSNNNNNNDDEPSVLRWTRKTTETKATTTGNNDSGHKTGGSNIFSKIDYFKTISDENGKGTNVPEIIEATTINEEGDEVTYNLRHIPIFFPMSWNKFPLIDSPAVVFAAVLALHDFNQNLSLVVPSVGEEIQACPNLKFTTSVIDSELSLRVGSERVAEILGLIPRRQGSASDNSGNLKNHYPTAIIGSGVSSVTTSMATLTGVTSVPLISGSASSGILDNKGVYPTFGRLIPADQGSARAVVSFLSEVLNVTHLGVLFVTDSYGSDFARAIKNEASMLNPPMVVALAPYSPDDIDISKTLRFLQNSKFRYFFGAIYFYEYVRIMTAASEHNITGPGYYWMFAEGVGGINSMNVEPNSSVVNATYGSTLISPTPPSNAEDESSRFEDFVWHWTNATNYNKTEDYFHSLLSNEVGALHSDIFWSLSNFDLAALMYETGMAIAFAACRCHKIHGPNFSGQQFFEEFLNVSFDGTMGRVLIDRETGTRDHRTITYAISSIHPIMTEDGMVAFNISRSYVNERTNTGGDFGRTWKQLEGANFIFSDNTTTAPDPLPPLTVETIVIWSWARTVGFTLGGIVLSLSIFFMIWTAVHRNSKVVKASQPVFLQMLCVGTFTIGLAIVTLTLQHPFYSDFVLDSVCMATPWLVSGGFVIAFSAILSKLKRVNAIFGAKSHKRLVVESRDVMRPFTILFVSNVAVLTAWTILDPLTYSLNYTDATDVFDRPIEVYGRCINYEPSAEYLTFAILWAAIIIAVVLWANVEAYRARGISTEYSESQHLAISIALILQAILVGLPLLFVVDAVPTFWYFVEISILFVISMSVLLPIFVPKTIYLKKWRKEKSMRELRKSQRIEKWAEMEARADEESEQMLIADNTE